MPIGATKQRAAAMLLPVLAIAPMSAAQTATLPATLECVEVVHAEANDRLTNCSTRRSDFSVTFSELAEGEYVMVGSLGATSLVTMRSEGFVQFVERTPVGNVNLTTILGKPEGGSTMQCTHATASSSVSSCRHSICSHVEPSDCSGQQRA